MYMSGRQYCGRAELVDRGHEMSIVLLTVAHICICACACECIHMCDISYILKGYLRMLCVCPGCRPA